MAYFYDLYIAPGWREAFDRMVDEEVKLPKEGRFLDAECGTGGYAIDMAIRGGVQTEVVGIDPSAEKLILARGKAEVKKADRVEFHPGSLQSLGFADDELDLVIGDASMLPPSEVGAALTELTRVAKRGATVVLKLTTRGSFDEFFSIYWEALYNLGLLDHMPQLESLITERLTMTDAEQIATDVGLKHVRSVTRKEQFEFNDGSEFLESPLIETFFLNDWLAMLPDEDTRQQVRQQLVKVIDEGCYKTDFEDEENQERGLDDEKRHKMDFDVSIKATLIIGQK